MGTQAFPVTAEQALATLQKWQKRNNHARRIPALSELEKKFSRENSVHIYNVGPWDHAPLDQGTLGVFYIPACPPGERFVRGPVIEGVYSELVIKDEKTMERLSDDGRFVANDIVGIGRKRSKRRSLIHFGCFVGSQVGPPFIEEKRGRETIQIPGANPTEQEIEGATLLLRAHMLEIFKEQDDAWALGPEKFALVSSVNGIMAARWLNREDAAWMKSSNPTHNVKCPKCGHRSEPDVMMCPTVN